MRIETTKNVCPTCEDYAKRHALKPIVVMCCEGGCLRGEIARRAANLLCHELAPEKTVRICLGGAFTKDTGQRGLVRNAREVLALEGCFIECAARMMRGVLPDLAPRVVIATDSYDVDKNLFGVDEMADQEISARAQQVAEEVLGTL